MRPSPRPPLTKHRLARLNAWARLWLVWFVGVCAAWWLKGEHTHQRAFDRLARGVGNLVVLNAAARFTPPPKSRHRHGRMKRASLRILIGASLRAAMRGRDAPTRLFAILAVMRDMERHVARLLRRIPRGLTRLRVVLPTHSADAIADACAPPLAPCADTS